MCLQVTYLDYPRGGRGIADPVPVAESIGSTMKDSYPARERNRISCTSVAESVPRIRRSTDPPCRPSSPNTVSSYRCPAAACPGDISTMATKSSSPDSSVSLGIVTPRPYSIEDKGSCLGWMYDALNSA